MKVCKVLNPQLHKYVSRLNKKPLEYRVADENLNKIFLGYQVENLFYVLEEYYAKFDEEKKDWLIYHDEEYKKLVAVPWNSETTSNHWNNYSNSNQLNDWPSNQQNLGNWGTNRTWGNTNGWRTHSQVSEGWIQNSQINCNCNCNCGNLPF